MVVSDKQPVKHLQKEVVHLEAELRTPEVSSPCSESLLIEKELKIKQMEIDMEELKREKDLAKLQLEKLQRKGVISHGSSHRVQKCLTFSGLSSEKKTKNILRQSSTVPTMLMQEIRKLEQLQNQLGDEANRAIEVLQKEVACHRLGNQDAAETIAKLQAEIKEMCTIRSLTKEVEVGNLDCTNLKKEITRLHSDGTSIANLEQQLENVQKSLDMLVMSLPNNIQTDEDGAKSSNKVHSTKKKLLPLNISTTINRPNLLKSPCSPLSSTKNVMESGTENKAPEDSNISNEKVTNTNTPIKNEDGGDVSSRESTPCNQRSSSVNMRKMQKMFQNAAEENVRSIKAYVTELKERVAKLQYQKQLLVCQVLELEANDAPEDEDNTCEMQESPDTWHHTFNQQMNEIIQLWDVCHVSIIHRTQFYLLFKGDPADQIYVEVELRRLKWLEKHLLEVGDSSPAPNGEDPVVSLSSSIKALRQEREFLSKRLKSRLTEEELERIYRKMDIPLDGKQRRLQLVNKLWIDTNDRHHIEESAHIVARLVGFCEGGNVSKEMFELNFSHPANKRPWIFGWQPISNLLRL